VWLEGIAVADWDGSGWPALLVSRLLRERDRHGAWHDTSWVEVYRRDVPKR